MRRKTFDALVSAGGLVLVAVLLVAGVLLLWGHSYASDQVSSQLSAQKIVFPAKSNAEFKALPASDQAAMGAYAGQPMTTGAQAKAYAASLAQPKNVALAAQVQTVFRGTTLRSMLLEAYGFWQIGQIALLAAIASFAGAGLLLILSIAGLLHGRRVPADTEVLAKTVHPSTVNA
jgi:hypothetical protein